MSDLDSLFIGCTWYNVDRNPSGTKPFNEYGFIIAFQAGGSNYFQIAIPFGALTHTPKWRSHVNNKWQNWRSFDVPVEIGTLSVNTSLIGDNNVKIVRQGRLRTINGYIRITETIKNNDILVYLSEADRPMNTQWCPSICFGSPATSRSSMNLTISTNGTDIHINDDLPLAAGTYGIFFVYYVS